jgi:hypothetical protein
VTSGTASEGGTTPGDFLGVIATDFFDVPFVGVDGSLLGGAGVKILSWMDEKTFF